MKPARPAKQWRWKLWHLAVLVLIAAPVFGAIRSLAGGWDGPLDGPYALVIIACAGLAPLAIIRVGRKVAGGATSGLKRWGIHFGGVAGFLAWLVAGGLELGFYVAAIVIGPVAAIALLWWLARLAGK